MNLRETLQFCKRRRWALFFLNLVAGLFAAPYLYWSAILMRVVLRAAQGEPVLLWLGAVNALGGLLFLLLAALGMGGCLSALRKLLRGEDCFLPREVFKGMGVCAKASLLSGALLGLSLGIVRVGLVNLHTLLPAGPVRTVSSAFLCLQLLLTLPLCLLALTRGGVAEAGRVFAQNPLRALGLTIVTLLPLLFFVWQTPLLTLLGFFFVALCGLVPAMLLWQVSSDGRGGIIAACIHNKRSPLPIIIFIFAALDCLILLSPLLRQIPDPQAALRSALDFISRLYADSGTLLRDLLAASSVWPLLLAALLGTACCVMAAYACACYKFRGRGLLFAAAVLLQIIPILASYASLERLLRNLELPISGVWLGLGWALVYLLVALLLCRRFAQLLPSLQKNREKFPGVRLFFYYALRRAPLYTIALFALATLGFWDDALAPFWYMRSLGAFSLGGYVWERLSGPGELALYIAAFLAMLGLFLLILRLRQSRLKSRSPMPSAD